jgi:hypothetical protein
MSLLRKMVVPTNSIVSGSEDEDSFHVQLEAALFFKDLFGRKTRRKHVLAAAWVAV